MAGKCSSSSFYEPSHPSTPGAEVGEGVIQVGCTVPVTTTPPNQGIPDKKSKCEEMMRMAQGTLQDGKNAISSHLPSVRGGFSGKIVTDGNPSTLLCPNPSQMTNAHIMQQCRTQSNVDFFDLVHINDHPMSFNHCNHMGSPICPPQMCH